jgi:hypothetical protein
MVFAYGEMMMTGTRAPSPSTSIYGGGTWSYQPPLSSQRTTMAMFGHALEFFTIFTKPSSHSIPSRMLPPPGCMSWSPLD